MSDQGRLTAIVDWARKHDGRVDPSKPNVGSSGFAVFQDRASLIMYCQDSAHRGDRLGDLAQASG
jgi:hypothetical protein